MKGSTIQRHRGLFEVSDSIETAASKLDGDSLRPRTACRCADSRRNVATELLRSCSTPMSIVDDDPHRLNDLLVTRGELRRKRLAGAIGQHGQRLREHERRIRFGAGKHRIGGKGKAVFAWIAQRGPQDEDREDQTDRRSKPQMARLAHVVEISPKWANGADQIAPFRKGHTCPSADNRSGRGNPPPSWEHDGPTDSGPRSQSAYEAPKRDLSGGRGTARYGRVEERSVDRSCGARARRNRGFLSYKRQRKRLRRSLVVAVLATRTRSGVANPQADFLSWTVPNSFESINPVATQVFRLGSTAGKKLGSNGNARQYLIACENCVNGACETTWTPFACMMIEW
jgi:hypothetical protein